MSRPISMRPSIRRFSTSKRALLAAAGAGALALALLVAHVFAPLEALEIAALLLLGCGLVAAWLAILVWRPPVSDRRRLAVFAALWLVGVALAVSLVFLAANGARSLLWRRSVEWLALTLSLSVGALFLRTLLRVRASSLSGRLLSLVSPFAILATILLLASIKA